jgi:glucose/arabinose dehydrogenase
MNLRRPAWLVLALGVSCGSEVRWEAPPEKHVSWTASRVVGTPDPPLRFRAVAAYPKLKFHHSLYVAFEPGTGRAMVVEQEGVIHAFANDPSVEKPETFLRRKDTWFYSMMFHPKYAENHWVYVFANGPPDKEPNKKDQILRYVVKDGRADLSTEHLVIDWVSNGHDGGEMGFGPDGMLYITAGDGTTDSDRNVTGQDISDLNSGMIRIDVEHPDPGRNYSIPKDNPFLAIPGARGELWAYGFRNPWRMCFDPKTGDLWVGDIGQDIWEMIEVVKKGDNYGWSVFEGGHPFHAKRKLGPTPVTPPAIVHHHSESRSITGGFVYQGAKYPDLRGAYLHGDYSTGRVWGARYEGGKITWQKELAKTPVQILGLAPDAAGDIYLADYGGAVWRLEPKPPEPPRDFPRMLSASGAFASVSGYRTHPGLVPYDVNSPLWSDGALKERHIGLPNDQPIAFSEGSWTFPEGTVLVKTFSLEMEPGRPGSRKRIETRFLTLQENEWVGYSYEWNDAQTDARLVDSKGKTREFDVGGRKQSWNFPSRSDCMVCHSRAANYVLGVTTMQMNRDGQLQGIEALGLFKVSLLDHVREQESAWTAIGDVRRSLKKKSPEVPKALRDQVDPQHFGFAGLDPVENALQLAWLLGRHDARRALEKEPRFTTRLAKRPARLPRLADPADATAPLESRARSYLHANCAQCHVEAGGGNSAFDVHVNTDRERMKVVDVKPIHDAFEIADPRIVAPGDPSRSILFQRITRRGQGQMPPLATSMVDERSAGMLREWIAGLK